ncbi:uncharacterized protein LOC134530483 [Bacillus rossius redtenbacheri]|uniref:uncharacterized protein LOC134530483 n=1 Tax=Bacillus rossius redtenbacheri TaxID=93214 RepID=UPI002FDE695A
MASDMVTSSATSDNNLVDRQERKLQRKLRTAGQPYVSRSGKLIPAKKQPESLCNCPQRCDEKIPINARIRLFEEFYKLADHIKQNDFLMAHIEMRAVQRRSLELKKRERRVSCKYQVPILTSNDPPIKAGPSPKGVKIAEVCQKAFMHIYAITEKRVRLQREKLISELSFPPPVLPPPKVENNKPSVMLSDVFIKDLINSSHVMQYAQLNAAPTAQSEYIRNLDKDIALVDNFFMNQLWKPELINTPT